jgi:hypothetical protein
VPIKMYLRKRASGDERDDIEAAETQAQEAGKK